MRDVMRPMTGVMFPMTGVMFGITGRAACQSQDHLQIFQIRFGAPRLLSTASEQLDQPGMVGR
jgi:hypothetical protein